MEKIDKNLDPDLFQFLEDELKLFEETCREFNGNFIFRVKSSNNSIFLNISETKPQKQFKVNERKLVHDKIQKPKLLPKPKLFPKPNLVK